MRIFLKLSIHVWPFMIPQRPDGHSVILEETQRHEHHWIVNVSPCERVLASLSHDPVTNTSGCCSEAALTGLHRVLLIFWEMYLALMHSIERFIVLFDDVCFTCRAALSPASCSAFGYGGLDRSKHETRFVKTNVKLLTSSVKTSKLTIHVIYYCYIRNLISFIKNMTVI